MSEIKRTGGVMSEIKRTGGVMSENKEDIQKPIMPYKKGKVVDTHKYTKCSDCDCEHIRISAVKEIVREFLCANCNTITAIFDPKPKDYGRALCEWCETSYYLQDRVDNGVEIPVCYKPKR